MSVSLNEDLSDRVILTCSNSDVCALNNKIFNLLNGKVHTYLSIDTAVHHEVDETDEGM